VRQNPPLTALAKCWEEQHFRDRWQSLLSVDDIVRELFTLLDELTITDKTFVIYSSDHGYKQGQFRIGTSKEHPYETDVHVPLLFAGPGIEGGKVLPYMSGNIDIMPTVLDMAGGTVRVFRQKFTLEDAIGSHACSLEANTRVTNGIPLGSPLLLPLPP
jgi:N-acetylglucosamine-6-sulfatase